MATQQERRVLPTSACDADAMQWAERRVLYVGVYNSFENNHLVQYSTRVPAEISHLIVARRVMPCRVVSYRVSYLAVSYLAASYHVMSYRVVSDRVGLRSVASDHVMCLCSLHHRMSRFPIVMVQERWENERAHIIFNRPQFKPRTFTWKYRKQYISYYTVYIPGVAFLITDEAVHSSYYGKLYCVVWRIRLSVCCTQLYRV